MFNLNDGNAEQLPKMQIYAQVEQVRKYEHCLKHKNMNIV